jgi:tRNA dimethylallyltransferase
LENKPKVVIIGGPTAVGKSKLALALQERHNGVLVNADATKLYRGLDCGANKWMNERRWTVRLWDVLDACYPNAEFSAGQYHDAAIKELDSILYSENKLPIVVGGTGLYIRWLMRGKQAGPKRDLEISKLLLQQLQDIPWSEVVAKIRAFDPEYAQTLVHNDYRRAVRALELHERTNTKISDLKRQRTEALHNIPDSDHKISDPFEDNSHSSLPPQPLDAWQKAVDFRPFVLNVPRVELYDLICRRCENMILDGLIMEVWQLMKRGLKPQSTPGKAIGYRQTIDFLNAGVFTEASFLAYLQDFQSKTRQLAHRQLAWFRKEPDFLNLPLGPDSADQISSYLALSTESWIDAVKSQSLPTDAELAQEAAKLRQYSPPTGLLLPERVLRRDRTNEHIEREQQRQALVKQQLQLLDYISHERKRFDI